MKSTLFENKKIKFELENGILKGTFKLDTYDLDTVRELVEVRLNFTKGRSYPMIANIISIKKISKEARVFFASEDGCKGIAAAALLIGSPIASMIGNFWIRINKPLRPTKLFTDESEAKKWLANYIEP